MDVEGIKRNIRDMMRDWVINKSNGAIIAYDGNGKYYDLSPASEVAASRLIKECGIELKVVDV
jgi:hypothetical protein